MAMSEMDYMSGGGGDTFLETYPTVSSDTITLGFKPKRLIISGEWKTDTTKQNCVYYDEKYSTSGSFQAYSGWIGTSTPAGRYVAFTDAVSASAVAISSMTTTDVTVNLMATNMQNITVLAEK